MSIRLIEVPIFADTDMNVQLDAALVLARKLRAHIRVTYIGMEVALSSATLTGEMIGADAYRNALEFAQTRKRDRKATFELWCARENLSHDPVQHRLASTFAIWEEMDGAVERIVASRARVSDLAVIANPRSGSVNASLCFDAAVFASGRPAMIVARTPQQNILGHVMVAWDGSLEATHAVAQCTQILHDADRVTIFSVRSESTGNQPEEFLKELLRWHGVVCETITPAVADNNAGAELLHAAKARGVTLIVMGAFTHSRIRELFLGGVTQHVLDHCEIPVVMTH